MKFWKFTAIFSILALVSVFFMTFALKNFCLLILCTILFMALANIFKNAFVNYICIVVFSLTFALSIAEGYFQFPKVDEVQTKDVYIQPDADLGFALKPNMVAKEKIVYDGQEVFDVSYTIDENARRIMPHAPDATTAVLLLGCSYTFGTGLNDKETFAYQLGEILGSDYQVFNFGVGGYGPHQMLAIIENHLPDLSKYKKILAYHIAISSHYTRSAGLSSWDQDGPRYLIENNQAVRKGSFKDNPPFFWESYPQWLLDNQTFKSMEKFLALHFGTMNEEQMIELSKVIMCSSAEKLNAMYPQAKFSVLAWPPNAFEMLNPVSKDIELVDVRIWLKDFDDNPDKYRLKDFHPNKLASKIVAKGFAELVQKDAANIKEN